METPEGVNLSYKLEKQPVPKELYFPVGKPCIINVGNYAPVLFYQKRDRLEVLSTYDSSLPRDVSGLQSIHLERSPNSSIPLSDIRVSRDHAVLTKYDNGRWGFTEPDQSNPSTIQGVTICDNFIQPLIPGTFALVEDIDRKDIEIDLGDRKLKLIFNTKKQAYQLKELLGEKKDDDPILEKHRDHKFGWHTGDMTYIRVVGNNLLIQSGIYGTTTNGHTEYFGATVVQREHPDIPQPLSSMSEPEIRVNHYSPPSNKQ